MDHFEYRDDRLFCDGVPAEQIAESWGTPAYVYCARTVRHHFRVLAEAFSGAEQPTLICYSVKANSNLHLMRELASLGAGFDVVSGGELARVLEI
ncbi:MAG: diaminopimelate decarboxylase, partial [Planctomycetota bacterium]